MTQPILVTGATGTLGRAVVARLVGAGHTVRIASRRPAPNTTGPQWATVDYHSGAGLIDAVENIAAIIHCAGEYRHINVDRRLVDAARRRGPASGLHLDRRRRPHSTRLLSGRLAVERLIAESALPFSILAYHPVSTTSSPDYGTPWPSLPVVPVPSGVRIQPIDVRDVAARLALRSGPLLAGFPTLAAPRSTQSTNRYART